MPSRKSDNLPAPLLPEPAPFHPWRATLLHNGPIPLVFLLLMAVGWWIEGAKFQENHAYPARIVMLVGINITLAVSLQLINGISGQFSLGHAGFMAVGGYLAGYAVTTYAPGFDNPIAVAVFFIALALHVAIIGAALWVVLALLRMSRRAHPALPGVFLVLYLGWVVADMAIAHGRAATPPYLIWSKTAEWLVAMFGATLEHGVPIAGRLNDWLGLHTPAMLAHAIGAKWLTMLVALIGGGLMAAAAGFVVGLPTLRLRGDYLAIATLGFAEIIRVAITISPPLGAATGLSVPTYPADPDLSVGLPQYYIFPWIYGIAFITILLVIRFKRSAKGRAIEAVREDEIAATAIGIDPTRHKVIAFVIGAFFAGVAGALYAHFDGYLNPNSFGLMRSVEIVVMVTLGGLGSVWGAVIVAIILTVLPEVLRNFSPAVAEYRMVIYSALLVAMMLLRSTGIFEIIRSWIVGLWYVPDAAVAE